MNYLIDTASLSLSALNNPLCSESPKDVDALVNACIEGASGVRDIDGGYVSHNEFFL
jgi:hypothetical protein